MHKSWNVCSAGLLALALAASAQGSVITVSALSSGWFTSDSSNNYFADGTENYFAGYCSGDGCGTQGEHRNFFTFAIPTLDGPVSSVVLTVNTGGVSFAQSPSSTYRVSSLPDGFGFTDIGAGTVFGSSDYSIASTDADQSIVLNSSAISAITPNSTFAVGGLLTTLNPTATQDQFLFGADGIGSGSVELTISTSDNPEPAALGLFAVGLAALVVVGLRRKCASGAAGGI